MSDEILTVLEVAALLEVANKTVYMMTQKGEIPAFLARGTAMCSPANPPLAGRAPSLLSCAEAAPRFGVV